MNVSTFSGFFKKSKSFQQFLKIIQEESIYFGYVVKRIIFEKNPVIEKNILSKKKQFFARKKQEFVNECLEMWNTYGRQRNSNPPTPVTPGTYNTPTPLQS